MNFGQNENVFLVQPQNLFLIGFMGAGKTTIGRLLASRIGQAFRDLDTEIQINEGRIINNIFHSKGENHFREIESQTLRNLVGENAAVISTGGGTPLYFDNLDWMKSHGKVVCLWGKFETFYGRLTQNVKSSRPLVTELNYEDLKLKYLEREKFYLQADLVIDCELIRSTSEIVENICENL